MQNLIWTSDFWLFGEGCQFQTKSKVYLFESCCCPLQVEYEKAALMTSLQESQTQLQHTQGALTEQHEKALRLSRKVIALRRLHRRAYLNQEAHASATSQLNHEALVELDRDEEESEGEGRAEEDKSETMNKSQVFSYQTPGLEILQCKYRVAVTEVVELKAEVKALQDRLAQFVEGAAEEKPRGKGQIQKLETQVSSLEKSCREGREKVTTSYRLCLKRFRDSYRAKGCLLLVSQISNLEMELQAAQSTANESHGALNAAQDELVTLSEELAQLYHHVCLCNNEMPNLVMLDYYRLNCFISWTHAMSKGGTRFFKVAVIWGQFLVDAFEGGQHDNKMHLQPKSCI